MALVAPYPAPPAASPGWPPQGDPLPRQPHRSMDGGLSLCFHNMHLSCSFHSDRKASGGSTFLQQDLSWFLVAGARPGSLRVWSFLQRLLQQVLSPAAARQASSRVPTCVKAVWSQRGGQAGNACCCLQEFLPLDPFGAGMGVGVPDVAPSPC